MRLVVVDGSCGDMRKDEGRLEDRSRCNGAVAAAGGADGGGADRCECGVAADAGEELTERAVGDGSDSEVEVAVGSVGGVGSAATPRLRDERCTGMASQPGESRSRWTSNM